MQEGSTVEGTQVPPAQELRAGVVESAAQGGWSVALDTGKIRAEKAFSCLVEPRWGDRVLVAELAGAAYILAVLERQGAQDTRLSFPGNVDMQAPNGDLRLTSDREVDLTGSEARVTAQRTRMLSREMDVYAEHLSARGGALQAQATEVSVTAKRSNTVIGRVFQRAEAVVRQVEQVETLHVGSLVQTVREQLNLRARWGVLRTSKDLSIDGEHIHMG
ncbi:DUF3540 domain-containing protein [Thiohalorhabdus sp. Cl-TMA]|uniref:DUF3540 domain-containing protein n=1 Tax=Thiohalorhabdus methylotrophus TaxID=3242694 RepID=A0ABV4TTC6_9GAMM